MSNFKSVEYANIGKRTTVCCVICDNGFEFVSSYCCKAELVNNQELRNQRAYENALRTLGRYNQKKNQDKS